MPALLVGFGCEVGSLGTSYAFGLSTSGMGQVHSCFLIRI
jgi:hypothetical protein